MAEALLLRSEVTSKKASRTRVKAALSAALQASTSASVPQSSQARSRAGFPLSKTANACFKGSVLRFSIWYGMGMYLFGEFRDAGVSRVAGSAPPEIGMDQSLGVNVALSRPR